MACVFSNDEFFVFFWVVKSQKFDLKNSNFSLNYQMLHYVLIGCKKYKRLQKNRKKHVVKDNGSIHNWGIKKGKK